MPSRRHETPAGNHSRPPVPRPRGSQRLVVGAATRLLLLAVETAPAQRQPTCSFPYRNAEELVKAPPLRSPAFQRALERGESPEHTNLWAARPQPHRRRLQCGSTPAISGEVCRPALAPSSRLGDRSLLSVQRLRWRSDIP